MGNTSIEWTDATWNPTRGCSIISEGCRNCYAMKQAHRFSGKGGKYEGLTRLGQHGPQWTGIVQPALHKLDEPLHWKKPRRVFVDSMSDLFHKNVPFEFIDKVFAVMALAPQHTFQILTKRPERMREYLVSADIRERITQEANLFMRLSHSAAVSDALANVFTWTRVKNAEPGEYANCLASISVNKWPLPNVHLGVSVENQPTADERIPLLLQTPAAVRFVSYEPALDWVKLDRYLGVYEVIQGAVVVCSYRMGLTRSQALNKVENEKRYGNSMTVKRYPEDPAIDWVIVGGESGPGARPFNIQWARDVIAQCKAAGVACFVKQLGANAQTFCEDHGVPHRLECLTDRKGGDMSEWPEDLRVREFPKI